MAASLDELKIDRSPGRRSRIVRIVWLVVVLAVLGGGSVAGWRWWEEARLPVMRTVVVRQALPADGQPMVLNASGYVTAHLKSTVSSKVTGRIVDVLVEKGMTVTEGSIPTVAAPSRRCARRASRRGPTRPASGDRARRTT